MMWGKKGAIGVVPESGDGALVTTNFYLFDVNTSVIDLKFLNWILRRNYLENQLMAVARGTASNATTRPKQLLACSIPLPPLDEQRRLVARIEALAAKIDEARGLRRLIETDISKMLLAAYKTIIAAAKQLPMGEVAPLVRRPVEVSADGMYPELGIRSFGKGTFHKPAVNSRPMCTTSDRLRCTTDAGGI
jgi:type I restriction enzyme S subunit